MITVKDINDYIELHDSVYETARNIAIYLAKHEYSQNSTISEISIGKINCVVFGDAYWAYGDHDNFSFSFPTSLITSNDWKKEADDLLNKWLNDSKKAKIDKEKKEAEEKLEREKKLYEELRKKFQ